MSITSRAVIFGTFFISCIAVALLVACLTTNYWIESKAVRSTNPAESNGRINFGLFFGKKDLNYKYGWRTYEFNVHDPSYPARKWCSLAVAVLCATSAVLSVAATIMAALFSAGRGSMYAKRSHVALLCVNCFSSLMSLCAGLLWLSEYLLRLKFNVMSEDNVDNNWTSNGLAYLGTSFWLCVGAFVCSTISTIIVGTVRRITVNFHRHSAPPLTPHPTGEKTNAAIMLY